MHQLSVMSVVVDEDEFLDPAMASQIDAFPVVYIKEKTGIGYKMRRRVKGGRHMVLPIAKLPGQQNASTNVSTTSESAEIKARKQMMQMSTDILPSGKIPATVLYQIISFFMSVMNNKMKDVVGGGKNHGRQQGGWNHEYEAMAHVIWNEHTKQYRVGIPTQRVSKASVSYDHDDYNAEAGDMVIVDIHSHNTMSAFFSGTDNTDDRGAYCYSGVIGNLDKTPTMKFRLNAGELKVELNAEEIFDFRQPLPEVPQEWLDKVAIQGGYNYGNYYGGGRGGANGWPIPGTREWWEAMDDEYEMQSFGPNAGQNHQGGGGKNRPGRFPTSRQGSSTVAKEIDDALTRFIKDGEIPEDILELINSGSIDLESFVEGLTTPGGAASSGLQEELADMFDPSAVHNHGAEFTKLIQAYIGWKDINSDTYPTLRTLGIYEELEELSKVWKVREDGTMSMENTTTGIRVDADDFIKDLSPLSSYFDDMLDAQELSEDHRKRFAQDVWELLFDIGNGLVF